MKIKMMAVFFAVLVAAVPVASAKQAVSMVPQAATGAPICPVSGDKADPEVTYVHEGKTYAFCCKGCINKFKKDPSKYIAEKKAAETSKHAEHGEHAGHVH